MLHATRHALIAVSMMLANAVTAAAAEQPEASIGPWGVDLAAMDPSVAPGENFYRMVNGRWLETAEIPPDRGRYGSFDALRILSEQRMRDLADGLAAREPRTLTAEQRKLRDLYLAFLDEQAIAARGLAPAKKDLATIVRLRSLTDVARVIGRRDLGLSGPVGAYISINDKNAGAYVLRVTQSGLGLPNRDYYLRDEPALAKVREAYQKYLATMFALAGLTDPARRAADVYAVEARIAAAQWTNAERRDRDKTYNPMTISALADLAPQFPWRAYLSASGISLSKNGREREVIVSEKSAIPKLAQIFAETPVAVWRDYLTARYLHAYAAVLPPAFDQADFAFYGTVVEGRPQQLARKIRAVHLLDAMLGEALGKIYVARFFPPPAREKVEALVQNVLKVYDAEIRVLPWMTETTRQRALDKLHKFTPHIGYPDQWRDYSAYRVSRDDLLGDVQRGAAFEWQRELRRIDQPVDRSEWAMTPPTVNAYYTQSLNAIFFPAAILQPPFFDHAADDAVNYGAIGAVIGHEISHGFDDQGSKYDGDGRLANWWTADDRKAFDAATAALIRQFDAYEPLPGAHINGAFTVGENIADLSGLTVAFKAYRLSLHDQPAPIKDGFTGEQRLFLAYGQIWREKQREPFLRRQLLSDPHAPGQFRTIGAVRNVDAWYAAFAVPASARFYLDPADRVRLW